MAVLTKDEYFSRISDIVGADTSDSAIKFVEDLTDTYNDMERRVIGDGEDWKKKYDELDKAWRERYRRRFFKPSTILETGEDEDDKEPEITPETIKVDDLFIEKEG